ncbi:MAG TPA: hypothetical protein VFL91_08520 [Thermomicrobiales bacterium]|nr:hypothetical protein [Thermomicrobiales bacterium]
MRSLAQIPASIWVWLVLVFLGLLLTGWALVDAVLDARALEVTPGVIKGGPRDIVARANLAAAAGHALVYLDFVALGLVATLSRPGSSPARRHEIGVVIVDGLIVGVMLLTVGSIVERLYRRKLLRALGARRPRDFIE